MKKNIAVVLMIMVVSMIGLFATVAGDTTATFDVSTSVTGLNYLAITNGEFTGTTLADWNTYNTANAATGATLASATAADVAYLNVLNNNRSGVSVYMQASEMSTTNTSYVLDYTTTVNGVAFDTSSDSGFVEIVTAAQSAATSGLFMESYAINVDIDDTTYDNAPEDTYTGTITFNFTGA